MTQQRDFDARSHVAGTSSTHESTTDWSTTTQADDPAVDYSTGIRHRIMIIDGIFLALAGTAQVTLELLAHFLGVGPYAAVFDRSAYTIGWVEAHGLAAVIGVVFLVVGARDRRRFWHGFALAVHLLLGAANLVFWQSFVDFGTTSLGGVGTTAHVLFATAQAWSLVVSRTAQRS